MVCLMGKKITACFQKYIGQHRSSSERTDRIKQFFCVCYFLHARIWAQFQDRGKQQHAPERVASPETEKEKKKKKADVTAWCLHCSVESRVNGILESGFD